MASRLLARERPAPASRIMAISAMPGHGQDARATFPRTAGIPIYRVILACSAKISARLLSTTMQLVRFRVNGMFYSRHFVSITHVFIHIVGSIFVFNIS